MILNPTPDINKINSYGSHPLYKVRKFKIFYLLSIPPNPRPNVKMPPTINVIKLSCNYELSFLQYIWMPTNIKIDIINIVIALAR